MLLKYIICIPRPAQHAAFSDAQRGWGGLTDCPGFVVQAGGWCQISGAAVILSLWRNRAHLDRFMAREHDPIIAGNGQARTIQSCEIRHLSCGPGSAPELHQLAELLGTLRGFTAVGVAQPLPGPGVGAIDLGYWSGSDAKSDSAIRIHGWHSQGLPTGYVEWSEKGSTALQPNQVELQPEWYLVSPGYSSRCS